ncbi:uncharacterized protein [Dermacentor albipictus]|uniref:uncharacterized protein isoform X2 n=1 Tax=Dermacentor albipictus TaxID=60249 RepID=UPI0031FDEA7C
MVNTSQASSPRRRRSHRRRGSRTVSGFEGDARTSAGATAAESRNKTAAMATRATTRATTARRATSSSSSSSSSETAHVIQMMKTQNLPKPPPDNWHSAVRLTAAVILSGTIFSLVMVVAYIVQTTGLLSWDSINTNEGTHPNGPEKGVTVAVAFHTNDTALPFSGANDSFVKPEGHLNYDQGEGDMPTLL